MRMRDIDAIDIVDGARPAVLTLVFRNAPAPGRSACSPMRHSALLGAQGALPSMRDLTMSRSPGSSRDAASKWRRRSSEGRVRSYRGAADGADVENLDVGLVV